MGVGQAVSGVLSNGLAAAGVAGVSLGAWLVTTTAPPPRTAFAPPAPLMARAAAPAPPVDVRDVARLDSIVAPTAFARPNEREPRGIPNATRVAGHGATATLHWPGFDSGSLPVDRGLDVDGASQLAGVDAAGAEEGSGPGRAPDTVIAAKAAAPATLPLPLPDAATPAVLASRSIAYGADRPATHGAIRKALGVAARGIATGTGAAARGVRRAF